MPLWSKMIGKVSKVGSLEFGLEMGCPKLVLWILGVEDISVHSLNGDKNILEIQDKKSGAKKVYHKFPVIIVHDNFLKLFDHQRNKILDNVVMFV